MDLLSFLGVSKVFLTVALKEKGFCADSHTCVPEVTIYVNHTTTFGIKQ